MKTATKVERAIAYLRFSTQRQHRSGLRQDAQRAAIERFVLADMAKERVSCPGGGGGPRRHWTRDAGARGCQHLAYELTSSFILRRV
jgi:hypothetical protein